MRRSNLKRGKAKGQRFRSQSWGPREVFGSGNKFAWTGDGTGRTEAPEDALNRLKKDIQAVEAGLHHLRTQVRQVAKGAPGVPVKAAVDPVKCVGCGTCQDVCPVGAILVDGSARVDADRCTGCGACVAQCPRGALTLKG